MFRKLWKDDAGTVALEYLLVATIVAIALVVGLSNLASALNVELTELSNAILSLNQSYSYDAASGCGGTHGGVTATDACGSSSYGQSETPAANMCEQSISITSCP
jgi:Flp pilus assembly pilin Flp